MSDVVAVTGSAEIDYATIDGSHIGAVIISLSEGAAAADTFSKHKAVMITKTEGQSQLDTVSKFKSALHLLNDACGNLDILSKYKAVMKSFVERNGSNDWSEFIYNIVTGHKYSDYPAFRVQNDSV